MAVVETREVRGRQLIQQLTEDLGWLEQHARGQRDRSEHAGRLHIAAALVRNCISPFIEGETPPPLHIAVLGGAGAGKSTITNFLTGAAVAEANPQAGFTRHPIAFTNHNGPLPWSQHLGFLGSLKRLHEPKPSNVDEDVYQVRKVDVPDAATGLLQHFVVWDCPDMTTWAATGYTTRLIEVVGLADLVIYVASDERYNDEVPTEYLQLILQAGKPVIACLMKMAESQAPALLDHFRREVIARIPECTRVAGLVAVPHMTPAQLSHPSDAPQRQALVEKVKWWTHHPDKTRRTAVRGAMDFLSQFQESLLSVAKEDLDALRTWRELVHRGRTEFENRYAKEYLSAEKFPRFDEALVRLLQLLELPGVGQYVSKALWLVRSPFRLAKGLFSKITGQSATASIPEEPVIQTGLSGWLDFLRKEAVQRGGVHALWDHVENGFQGSLSDAARNEFQRCLKEFQLGLSQEVEQTARAIYEELERSPVALNSLRSVKFAVEAGSIGLTIAAGGLNVWDVVLVPLVAWITQELTELLGKQYVDVQRENARHRQKQLFQRSLAAPLEEFLASWPATGGSTFEQLQLALKRIPEETEELRQIVLQRLEGTKA